MPASTAATAQLSVPIIAAIAGILFLSESITLRFMVAGCAVLGGIWLVISQRKAA
ncbi:MAG: EamA family transporter [Pontibacterium sp.]